MSGGARNWSRPFAVASTMGKTADGITKAREAAHSAWVREKSMKPAPPMLATTPNIRPGRPMFCMTGTSSSVESSEPTPEAASRLPY